MKRKPAKQVLRSAVEIETGIPDPFPRPKKSLEDVRFLEQITHGRWLEFPMPPDMQKTIWRLAEFIADRCAYRFFGDSPTADQMRLLQDSLAYSYRRGYFLALLRYENDLKHVPEAAALLKKEQTRKETARRNGKVRAEKAAPTHKAIRKRFRELRKTTPKKTVRYLRVAKEFEKSERQIARIVEGID